MIKDNDLECSNDLSGAERLADKVQCTMNHAADLHDPTIKRISFSRKTHLIGVLSST